MSAKGCFISTDTLSPAKQRRLSHNDGRSGQRRPLQCLSHHSADKECLRHDRSAPFPCIVLCTSQLSDAQHMLAANRFLVVGLPKVLHREDRADDWLDNAGVDQTRDLDQLNPVWFDDEESIAHSWLGQPFSISRNGYQSTAFAQDPP